METRIEISSVTLPELEYLLKLHAEHGAPNEMRSLSELVNYVLMAVADGSRRPGAWERELLNSMGLVANTPLHHVYRAHYGPPAEA